MKAERTRVQRLDDATALLSTALVDLRGAISEHEIAVAKIEAITRPMVKRVDAAADRLLRAKEKVAIAIRRLERET